jgi:LPS O-antigen subunit length determinant protein (WzzB/FepE family)
MNTKKNYLHENEVDFAVLLRHLWKEKNIIFCISILTAIFFYIYIANTLKQYQSQITIQAPQYIFFDKYLGKLDQSQDRFIKKDAKSEISRFDNDIFFEKMLTINFVSNVNFNLFKNHYKSEVDFKNARLVEAKQNKNILKGSYIFIYPENIDGFNILKDYADFILSETKKEYKNILKINILEEIKRHENMLQIAQKIELTKPLVSIPEKDVVFNEYSSLIFDGTVVLKEKIVLYKELLNILDKDKFDYKYILDHTSPTPFELKSKFFYTLSGLIFGLFLSLLAIYFKSLLKIKKN